MSGAFEQAENHSISDRRVYSRLASRSLAYVELDEGNGGIVLNVSEGGLSVQAVMSLMDDVLPRVRFQLSQSNDWIETGARIAWKSESKKIAGLQFLDLPEQAHSKIKEWLVRESLPAEFVSEGDAPAGESYQNNSHPAEAARHSSVQIADSTMSIPHVAERVSYPASSVENDIGIAGALRKKAKEEAFSSSGRIFGRTFSQTRDADFGPVGQALATQLPRGKAKEFPGTWALFILFVFLAATSGSAGWFAGRSSFNLFSVNSGKSASTQDRSGSLQKIDSGQDGAPSPLNERMDARGTEIEILDSNNQRWTIPFNALGIPSTRDQGRFFSSAAGETGRQPSGRIVAQPVTTAAAEQPHAGVVQHGKIVYRVDPIYPKDALEKQIDGIVELHITIGPEGNIRSVQPVSGPDALMESALTAVRQWRYSPAILDGMPVETQENVTFTFRLP